MSERSNVITLVSSNGNDAVQQLEVDLCEAIVKAENAGVSPLAIIGLLQCHVQMETEMMCNPDLIE